MARSPQLEETPETPPSSRSEGLLFLHGLESNPGSSLQTEEAGRDWGQEEKWTTEDETVGWHQQLNGHEFE